MKFKVQVVVESESGETQLIQEVAQIERVSLQPDNLGLTIAEAKEILHNTQRHIAFQQVAEYEKQSAIYSIILIPMQSTYLIGSTSRCG